ncbi:hypothetical protein EMIT0P294_20677 [Pseudomonas sp. IT-P294]
MGRIGQECLSVLDIRGHGHTGCSDWTFFFDGSSEARQGWEQSPGMPVKQAVFRRPLAGRFSWHKRMSG